MRLLFPAGIPTAGHIAVPTYQSFQPLTVDWSEGPTSVASRRFDYISLSSIEGLR